MGFSFIYIVFMAQVCAPLNSKKFKNCQPLGDSVRYTYPSVEDEQWQKNLKEFITVRHRALSYQCLWKALSETDAPPLTPSKIQLFYKRRYLNISKRDCGKNDPDSWNREHIWAKSRGFPKKSSWAYRDLHHIRPSDRSVNTWRSNRYFLEFDHADELFMKRNEECIQGCWKNRDYFEPPSEVKGEVARSLLYMAFRYDGLPKERTPDLEMWAKYPEKGSKKGFWGGLCTLVQWHLDDPPHAMERYRNHMVQIWQGNRNPFVDHPEWVQAIFGDNCT
jgi:uncharacterized protein